MDQLPSSNELKRKKSLEQLPTTKKRLLRQDDDISVSGDLAVEEEPIIEPIELEVTATPTGAIPQPSTAATAAPSPTLLPSPGALPHAVSKPLTPPLPLPTPVAPPGVSPATGKSPTPVAPPPAFNPADANATNTPKAPDTNLLMQRGTAPITDAPTPLLTTPSLAGNAINPSIETNAKPLIVKSVSEVPTSSNFDNSPTNAHPAGAIKLNNEHSRGNSEANGGSETLGVLTEYGAPKQEPSTGLRGLLPFALMIVLFLIILSVVVYIVPTLREKVAAKLPSALGKYLVNIEQVTERVSVQPQPIVYDEKTQSATLSGIVTNLTDTPVPDIQLEFTFARRNDVRQLEVKLIPIEPTTLGPKAQGTYKFTVSTKEFQENSVTKVLSQQGAIRFRKLSPVPPSDPTPSEATPSRPRNNKPTSDDGVYEGTVE